MIIISGTEFTVTINKDAVIEDLKTIDEKTKESHNKLTAVERKSLHTTRAIIQSLSAAYTIIKYSLKIAGININRVLDAVIRSAILVANQAVTTATAMGIRAGAGDIVALIQLGAFTAAATLSVVAAVRAQNEQVAIEANMDNMFMALNMGMGSWY